MSETLDRRGAQHILVDPERSLAAALAAWRWKYDRAYFTLNEGTPGTWLRASRRRPSHRDGLIWGGSRDSSPEPAHLSRRWDRATHSHSPRRVS